MFLANLESSWQFWIWYIDPKESSWTFDFVFISSLLKKKDNPILFPLHWIILEHKVRCFRNLNSCVFHVLSSKLIQCKGSKAGSLYILSKAYCVQKHAHFAAHSALSHFLDCVWVSIIGNIPHEANPILPIDFYSSEIVKTQIQLNLIFSITPFFRVPKRMAVEGKETPWMMIKNFLFNI